MIMYFSNMMSRCHNINSFKLIAEHQQLFQVLIHSKSKAGKKCLFFSSIIWCGFQLRQ